MMIFFKILWIIILVMMAIIETDGTFMGSCLKTRYHLNSPESNVILYQKCSPWSAKSCCSLDISLKSHQIINQYGFNISHCGPIEPGCHEFFIRELCFYSCDPYTKPWMITDPVTGKERLMQVPLCKNDCLEWWNRCANTTMTCVRNWRKHFVWLPNPKQVRTNFCPNGTRCRLFRDVYRDAFDFCQTIWDDAWKVTDDKRNCISFVFFNRTVSNRDVAEFHQKNLSLDWMVIWILIYPVILFVIYIFYCLLRDCPKICQICCKKEMEIIA